MPTREIPTFVEGLMTITRLTAAVIGGALCAACSDPVIPNYNDPTLPVTLTEASQLKTQAAGLVTGDRENHAFQILILETMGRDAYRLDGADPRYIQNPLGGFSPSAFIADFLYTSHYRTIHSAIALVAGLTGSPFSAAQKAGARGFARTIQANEYLRLINSHDTTGLPIVLANGLQMDPIRCKPAVLAYVAALLDSAQADLASPGASFLFPLPSGFAGFDTPSTFLTFNRALQAKVRMYQGYRDYAASGGSSAIGTIDQSALGLALAAVNASFADTTAPLRTGVFHTYLTASGDLINTNYDNTVYRANPRVVAEAEPGDARLAKVAAGPNLTIGYTSSSYLFTIVQSPTAPLPIVTNAELILTKAEILWGLGRYLEALALVNVVRLTDGQLPPKTPADFAGFATVTGKLGFLREILKQKRYSLLWESDMRVVDYRMFGLFSELGPENFNPASPPPPVTGPKAAPLPEAEADARGGNLACTP